MSKEGNGQTQKIVVEYKESPDYRVIPANGAWGGLTPRGQVMMALYVEHANTPRSVTHDVQEGKLGPEISRETSSGTFIRQLQVGIMMDPDTAESVAKWLLGKVEEYNKRRKGAS